jgi:hypothetical protein
MRLAKPPQRLNDPIDPMRTAPKKASKPSYVRITDRVRLSREIREEIDRRLAAGERPTTLAREFGVSHQAVSMFRKILRANQAADGLGRQMSPEETEKLKSLVLSTDPADHKLMRRRKSDPPGKWTLYRTHALAEKIAGRTLLLRPINRLLKSWFPANDEWVPPKPGDVVPGFNQPYDDKTLKRNKKFMEYIRSPVAQQIRERELAMARARYEEKLAREAEEAAAAAAAEAPQVTRPPALALPHPKPLVRVGKHKSSKGSPFTKSKKKKKK